MSKYTVITKEFKLHQTEISLECSQHQFKPLLKVAIVQIHQSKQASDPPSFEANSRDEHCISVTFTALHCSLALLPAQ